jgi:hypothetical protein
LQGENVHRYRKRSGQKENTRREVGSMSYMMSRLSYLVDSIGHGPARLMFFGPNKPVRPGWGENLSGSPIFSVVEPVDSPEPLRTYIISYIEMVEWAPVLVNGHTH